MWSAPWRFQVFKFYVNKQTCQRSLLCSSIWKKKSKRRQKRFECYSKDTVSRIVLSLHCSSLNNHAKFLRLCTVNQESRQQSCCVFGLPYTWFLFGLTPRQLEEVVLNAYLTYCAIFYVNIDVEQGANAWHVWLKEPPAFQIYSYH